MGDRDSKRSTIKTIDQSSNALHIEWQDGHQSTFHYIWLRDNDSRGSVSIGQNSNDTFRIPLDIAPVRVTLNGTLDIQWSDGSPTSRLDPGWLRANAYEPSEVSTRRLEPTPWRATDVSLPAAYHGYSQVASGDAAMRAMLQHLRDFGFAILNDVPCERGRVLEVLELFGYVRETNYGKMWEIKVVPTSEDLGYTDHKLPGHIDKPYRDPSPTITLLHCLANRVDGGDSTLVDGFCLAEELRHTDPAAFELLATTPVTYLYRDADTELRHEGTIIGTDGRKKVTHIRMNPFSIQPFYAEPETMMAFYAAYQEFGRMMEDDAYRLTFKLNPGDLLILDNLRILHGRLAYKNSGGERLLEGCFSDQDSFWSKLAVLDRRAREPLAVLPSLQR